MVFFEVNMSDLVGAITFIIMIGCFAVALIFINSEGFLSASEINSVHFERNSDNSSYIRISDPRIWTSNGEIY
jgi:hypothetical protein